METVRPVSRYCNSPVTNLAFNWCWYSLTPGVRCPYSVFEHSVHPAWNGLTRIRIGGSTKSWEKREKGTVHLG